MQKYIAFGIYERNELGGHQQVGVPRREGETVWSVEYFCCPNNCCRATRETQFHYDSLTQGKTGEQP